MAFFMLMFIMLFVVFLICIPIMIANARGLTGGEKTTVIILSWLGIFFGVTWIVALILSLVWRGDVLSDLDNLDKLEKLARLYKEKAITEKEYKAMKAKLLRE